MKKNHLQLLKHYVYYIVALVIIILLFWYGFSWYKVIKEEKLKKSYLLSTNTVSLTLQNIDEIQTVMRETPNNFFVLITFTNDENNYKLEKKLKNIIDNNELSDNFYYLDVTDIKDDDNILNKLNKAFDTKLIEDIPCILVYEDSKFIDILQNDDKIINNLQNEIKKLNEKN